jgi:hypothetical protein
MVCAVIMLKPATIQVEGVEYHWSVYRPPRWTSAGVLLGVSILVVPLEPARRELVLEFAIDATRQGDMPQHQRFRIAKRRLIECIQNALRAGWDPNSRGKQFMFDAGPVNPN